MAEILPEKPRRSVINWFRLFLLIIFVYFVYIIFGQQLEIMRINHEVQAVNSRLAHVSDENTDLINEKNNLNTLKHIEKLAREHLGMVKPGEVPYIPTVKPSEKS